jgi:ferritin-like metal-binding protein YciE
MADAAQEHLLNHLRDVHAVELQALRQLARAVQRPEEEISSLYEEQLEQTREHEQRIAELVEGQGHSPSAEEDKTLRGGAVGIRQLADIPLDTPVKLTMNLFALEHLEIAAYSLLAEIARSADEEDVARAAEEILEQKCQAVEKIADSFDQVAQLGLDKDDSDGLMLAYLADLHALEQQAITILGTACEEVCQDEQLGQLYKERLEGARERAQRVDERLQDRDSHPSAVKDLHFSTAEFGLRDLAKRPPDAMPKLAMNVVCVAYLQVAAYELVARMAKECGDSETAEMAEKIAQEEREAADGLKDTFARSVELMLENEPSYEHARAAEVPAS